MAAPNGITCRCGAKATKVHDIVADNGSVYGRVWACDTHSDEIAGSALVGYTIEQEEDAANDGLRGGQEAARRVCRQLCLGGFACTFTIAHDAHRCDLMGCECNEGTKPTTMCDTCGRTEFDCDAANDCTGAIWPVPKQDAKGA